MSAISTQFPGGFKARLFVWMRGLGRDLARFGWGWQGLALVLAAVWLGLSLSKSIEAPRWVRLYGVEPPPQGPIVLRVEKGGLDQQPQPAHRQPLKYFTRSHAQAALRDPNPVLLDEEGFGVISFATAASDFRGILRVVDSEQVLAEGPLRWPYRGRDSFLTRRSAWFDGKLRGQLPGEVPRQVQIGAMDGRLVRGRKTRIVVALAISGPLPTMPETAPSLLKDVPIVLEAQGLKWLGPGGGAASTDPLGRAYFEVVPEDLTASLTITVGSKLEPHTEFSTELPIEQAGFWGNREGDSLRVSSLIPLSRLYYALVTAQGLLARGAVDLNCGNQLPCGAPIQGLAVPQEPAWLVVGREPALDGKTAIGWAVSGLVLDPPDTVYFKESCLLDGKHEALRRHAEQASKRARKLVSGFAVVSLLFLGSVFVRVRRARLMARDVVPSDDASLALPVRSDRWIASLFALLALSLLALGLWIFGRVYGN